MDVNGEITLLHTHLQLCRKLATKPVWTTLFCCVLVASTVAVVCSFAALHVAFVLPSSSSCFSQESVARVVSAKQNNQSFVVSVRVRSDDVNVSRWSGWLPDELLYLITEVNVEVFRFSPEKGLLMLREDRLRRLGGGVLLLSLDVSSNSTSCFGGPLLQSYWSVVGAHTPIANHLVAQFGSGFVTCSLGYCTLM
jgi:hypothetical protein